MSSEMVLSVCNRTGLRKRRRQTASSTDSSRSSLSSSLIATSASRVMWNGCDSTMVSPGNRDCRLAAITCSIQTNFCGCGAAFRADFADGFIGTTTSDGSPSGTFRRAKCSRSSDSRSTMARFRLRLEMCGNGRPGSNASGVSTGKTVSR